jgi:hypothetical protein
MVLGTEEFAEAKASERIPWFVVRPSNWAERNITEGNNEHRQRNL